MKAKVNGKQVIDVNIDEWKEPNKNPGGSKTNLRPHSRIYQGRVISVCNTMGNPYGLEILRLHH